MANGNDPLNLSLEDADSEVAFNLYAARMREIRDRIQILNAEMEEVKEVIRVRSRPASIADDTQPWERSDRSWTISPHMSWLETNQSSALLSPRCSDFGGARTVAGGSSLNRDGPRLTTVVGQGQSAHGAKSSRKHLLAGSNGFCR